MKSERRVATPSIRRRELLAALLSLPPLAASLPAAAAYRGTIERRIPASAHPEPIVAAAPPKPLPVVNIVIDDIGNRLPEGRRAVALPVTCSFLPHTAHCRELVETAHRVGREIVLHTPMQSIHGKRLGPGGLTVEMTSRELRRTMHENFEAVPYADGVSNHMGSLLTRHPGQMQLVMDSLQAHHGGYFIDSLTTSRSVAYRIARESGIPASKRNIFLDHHRDPERIREQFMKLIARAHRRGTALGIGHPYPETLAVLEALLPRIAEQGVELVTTSRLIELQSLRDATWRAS